MHFCTTYQVEEIWITRRRTIITTAIIIITTDTTIMGITMETMAEARAGGIITIRRTAMAR